LKVITTQVITTFFEKLNITGTLFQCTPVHLAVDRCFREWMCWRFYL